MARLRTAGAPHAKGRISNRSKPLIARRYPSAQSSPGSRDGSDACARSRGSGRSKSHAPERLMPFNELGVFWGWPARVCGLLFRQLFVLYNELTNSTNDQTALR